MKTKVSWCPEGNDVEARGKRRGDAVMMRERLEMREGKEEARTVASSESRRPNDDVEAREEVAEDALGRLGVGGLVAADF